MTDKWIDDLRLAASFVRSAETGNHGLNFELRQLADRIEAMIGEIRLQGPEPVSSKGVTEDSDEP